MFLKPLYKNTFMQTSARFDVMYILFSILLSLISVNSLLTFLSLIILYISIRLVWRTYEPSIFIFIIFYHWLQISTKIFHANILGLKIQSMSLSNSTEEATYLSLVGLFFLSFGIYFVLRKIKPSNISQFQQIAQSYSLKKLFNIYLGFFSVFVFIKTVLFIIPGITQIIVGFLGFKIILIYFIFLISLIQKKYQVLVYITIIETVLGMTGFFSSFKLPYFILGLSYFTINYKVSFRLFKFFIPLFIVLLVMATTWSSIKGEYRLRVNEGQEIQAVTVSRSEQIGILYDLLSKVDYDSFTMALNTLGNRLAYVDFFGQVIDYVPKIRDYEYGTLWLGSIEHILTPRILFPNKPILDDSERTMKYTGHYYADLSRGTSFSIGYFAESYIDFGPYGMYFPIFLMGILYGLLYKYLIKNVKNPILAYSMITTTLLPAYLYEIRNDKLLGGVIMAFIMLLIMKRLFMSKLFNNARSII